MTDVKRKGKKKIFADHRAIDYYFFFCVFFFFISRREFFSHQGKTEAHAVSYIYKTATYGQSHQ
jgi:hypothetical protein